MSCCGFQGGGTPGINVPGWFKFTITFADFPAVALTQSITLYTAPPATVLHGCKLKHSIIWTGPAITNYFLSLGVVGLPQALMTEYDVKTTPIAGDEYALAQNFDGGNHTANTIIQVTARAVGANLSTATAGTAEVWLLLSRAL